MPSVSRAQQRLFGMISAYKKGKLKHPSSKVKKISKSVNAQQALDFARKVIKNNKG
jgi:hypothetical protein